MLEKDVKSKMDRPEVKWLGTEDIKDNMEVDLVNQLALSQACLGVKADDTLSHVVQVTTTGFNSNKITQPIIVLGCDVKQIQCRLEFSNAATFKLIEGYGPVHLSGNHIQVLAGAYSGSESDGEDAETSLEKNLELINMKTKPKSSPNKPKSSPNKPKSSPNKQPPAKKAKLDPVLNNSISDDEEDEEDSEEEAEEEEDDESVKLVPVKDAKPSAKTKNQKKLKASEKKKESLKTVEPDADEASEESINADDSEQDDDNDEDFKAGGSGSDGGIDDDDDDDEDDDEEDDDDSDEESDIDEDEITSVIAAKKKLRNQKNEEKTPSKNTPTERRTPRKSSLNASLSLQKSPDIATVKQSLLKSPNLPKKMDKFKNFMRMNMKITDEKVVKELWIWLKKNKK